jgi:CRISPR-associated endoribonuclease Cas6
VEQTPSTGLATPSTMQGELFSMLLRLHPGERGQVSLSAGNQIQAAFLDLVRQSGPDLAERLHTPNQRRPYTLSPLQGFNHLSSEELEEAMNNNQMVGVSPGQVYWLRISMLDATIFGTFARSLITRPRELIVRIGDVRFEVSRLLTTPDPDHTPQSWIAHSSFAELHSLQPALKQYYFEFASPTAFSAGQKQWGKLLTVFPEPGIVFESLARQWQLFAPPNLSLDNLTPQAIRDWCKENVVVSRYNLSTRYLPSSKFGQIGFQGTITYQVKGDPNSPEAQWLTPLARFALFSGIGYKTTMGMGQARCANLNGIGPSEVAVIGDES